MSKVFKKMKWDEIHSTKEGLFLGAGTFPPVIADERQWVLIQEAAETHSGRKMRESLFASISHEA